MSVAHVNPLQLDDAAFLAKAEAMCPTKAAYSTRPEAVAFARRSARCAHFLHQIVSCQRLNSPIRRLKFCFAHGGANRTRSLLAYTPSIPMWASLLGC